MNPSAVFTSTTMLEVASGFKFTEGPVWHPDGYLLFSDIPATTIYMLEPNGVVSPWREDSGNSNGLTFDRQGRLLACEHGNRRVSRTENDDSVHPLATHYDGKRLNSPNDIVVRSDGNVYFTDPPYAVSEEDKELDWNGLYRISPQGDIALLVDDFERCNGLAFSPNESVLYVDDTWRRHIRAWDVAPDGSLSNERLFCEMSKEGNAGPDGMKLDVEGNLYCTGPLGLHVYSPEGELIASVSGAQQPANLAFGGADLRTLYITARTGLYSLRTRNAGIPVI